MTDRSFPREQDRRPADRVERLLLAGLILTTAAQIALFGWFWLT